MRRKLVAAFAISLSVLLLAGAAVGSSNRPLGSGQEGTFTFAPLRIGDQAEYSVTIIDGKGNIVSSPEPLWQLAWTEHTTTFDFEGRERDVVMAFDGWPTHEEGAWGPAGTTWAVEPGTWNMITSSYLDDAEVSIVDGERVEEYSEQRAFIREEELYILPCPMLNRFAGQTVNLDETLVLFKHCSWQDHWTEDVDLKAIHRGTFGEAPSVTFRSGFGNLYQATFMEDISFPVEMVVEVQDESDRFLLIRLETFDQGGAPLPTSADAPGPSQFTAIEYASWDRFPFGVFDQPYRMDDALDDALAQPDGPNITAWMNNHADWYVADGRTHQSLSIVGENQTETDDFWHFSLWDGSEGIQFTMLRTTTEAPVTDLVDPLILLEGTPEPSIRYELQTIELLELPYPVPHRDVLPKELPLAQSLLPRWNLLSDHEESNAVTFRTGCVGTCDDWFYEVGVGIELLDRRESGFEWTRSNYEVSERPATGPGMSFRDSYWRVSPAEPGQLNSVPTMAAVNGAAWTAPAQNIAFTVGSIGLFGGILGLAWPTIRNLGLVRLFSRIHGDRLLEHPQRQRIMEAVYAEPGVHVRALRQRLELGSGVADHHLRKMESSGLIQVDRRGSYVCLYPKGHMDHSAMAAVPLMKGDGARSIVDALRNGPALQSELAGLTGLSKGTLSYHLRRLTEVGALESVPEGRTRRVNLSSLGLQAAAATPAA